MSAVVGRAQSLGKYMRMPVTFAKSTPGLRLMDRVHVVMGERDE